MKKLKKIEKCIKLSIKLGMFGVVSHIHLPEKQIRRVKELEVVLLNFLTEQSHALILKALKEDKKQIYAKH